MKYKEFMEWCLKNKMVIQFKTDDQSFTKGDVIIVSHMTFGGGHCWTFKGIEGLEVVLEKIVNHFENEFE